MSLFFIVDGYNAINRSQRFSGLTLRQSRERFLSFLETRRPQGSVRNRLTVVFDGSLEVFGFRESRGFEIIFTKGISADDKIKELVEGMDRPESAVVVTDDRDLGHSVKQKGAFVMSTVEFLAKGVPSGKTPGDISGQKKERSESDAKHSLNIVERERITEELRKIWLKD